MIIAVNGYIGSGKDTVGKMIQYLLCDNTGDITLQEMLDDYRDHEWWLQEQSGWEIRKFAGKLKRIASILTGIPMEKFEDQEFKLTNLPEEWNIDRIYESSAPWIVEGGEKYESPMTVREFLQKLGTEAIRNGLHPNAWVNATFADYKGTKTIGCIRGMTDAQGRDTILEDSRREVEQNWIITDCRFPNEAQAVKDRGGIMVRVNRDLKESPYEQAYRTTHHPSETALGDWNFDYTIENDGSLEELMEKVREMLKTFGIISPEVINNQNN